ncbi:hypothetical protein HK096_009571, partial [Nowakowskiella sp. JEL0078]
MIDLQSQLPTRRFFNTLFQDHVVIPMIRISSLFERISKNVSEQSEDLLRFKQLFARASFYTRFEIEELTGTALTEENLIKKHYSNVKKLQRLAFAKYRDDLEDFALANVAAIDSPERIRQLFKAIDDFTLRAFCKDVGIRVSFNEDDSMQIDEDGNELKMNGLFSKAFLIEVLVDLSQKRESQIDKIGQMSLFPDEVGKELFDESLVPYDQFFSNSEPLAIPKLSLQFLTLHDYLLRNFTLFQLESNHDIRQDIEDVIRRMKPKYNAEHTSFADRTAFGGWARMSVPLDSVNVTHTGLPKLGTTYPSVVNAELTFDLARFTDSIRKEWDALKTHDVMFLVCIQSEPELPGWALHQQKLLAESNDESRPKPLSFRKQFGIKFIRGVEFEENVVIEEPEEEKGKNTYFRFDIPIKEPTIRKIKIKLDPIQFQRDSNPAMYNEFNVLIRRKPQENNFKSVLETIRDLMSTTNSVPDWLADVFL